ncbi:MAG: hypothetical protein NZ108_11045, partial [Bacteroidia bacterium]|nr:hypothetical protein [Bacteroidia bacterium]
MIAFRGTATNRVLVTRQGNGTYTFNLGAVTPGNNFEAIYTTFEYMNTTNGINLGGSSIHATNNLSYCAFSNYTNSAGVLLTLPDAAIPNIVGVRFFYAGTPTVGTHFNVTKVNNIAGAANFIDPIGNLSGEKFERDLTGVTTPGKITWSATNVYWGNFTSGNWNDLPSKWRDINGNVVPIPTGTTNVILDHTHCPFPYTVTLDAPSSAKNLTINSNGQAIKLQCGFQILNLEGSFEMSHNLDTLQSSTIIYCKGDWQMNQGNFLSQGGCAVHFIGNSAEISSGTNEFQDLVINCNASRIRLSDPVSIKRNFFLTTGIFDVGSQNNSITIKQGNWTGTNGIFVQGKGTVYFLGNALQT